MRDGLDDGKELRGGWNHFYGRRSQIPALPSSLPLAPADGSLSFDLEIGTLVGEVKLYRL